MNEYVLYMVLCTYFISIYNLHIVTYYYIGNAYTLVYKNTRKHGKKMNRVIGVFQCWCNGSSYSEFSRFIKLSRLLSVFSILKLLNSLMSNKKIHYHNLLDVNFLNLIFVFFQIKSKMEK